jgi:transcription antitermination factor NusG
MIASVIIDTKWYALRVKSNREKVVAEGLRYKGYEVFLPCYPQESRWSDRTKVLELPLFPGYVFCRMEISLRLPALKIPGSLGFVEIRKVPIAVSDGEIEALARIISAKAPVVPWPSLHVGERVRIERGPLRDIEGVVADLKAGLKLIVSVELLQRSVAVEISRDVITPVRRSPAVVNLNPKPAILRSA